jgi:FKBP-type peptidyl-prolyl cis-trans isomerase
MGLRDRFRRHLPFRPAAPRGPSELLVEDLVVGQGAAPRPGRSARIRVDGRTESGRVIDDGERELVVGEGRELPGIEQGLAGMREGGTRRLTVPSRLGWGTRGDPGRVHPNTVLIYEIVLLSVG